MITKIALKNFKCFRDIEVNPRLITVLIGPNGSGKSSLIQSLLLLRQSKKQHKLITEGPIINLGTVDELVTHIKKGKDDSKVLLEMQIDGLCRSGFPEVKYAYNMVFDGGQLEYGNAYFTFKFEQVDHSIKGFFKRNESQKFESSLSIDNIIMRFYPSNQIAQPIISGSSSVPPGKENLFNQIKSIIDEVLSSIDKELNEITYIPAIRGFSHHNYSLGEGIINSPLLVAMGFENYSKQFATNFAYKRELLEREISEMMLHITGAEASSNVIPDKQVQVLAKKGKSKVNIVNEGFGTNQLMQLLWLVIISNKNSTILIEEPEIHLHPRAQANLASVLANKAKQEDKQLIISTHSEHFLHRLLTLIAEGSLSNDELSIYAFEMGENGIAKADALEIDKAGRIKGGLKNFFEVEIEELNSYLQALSKARKP